ncbi:hypothetical protein Fmac_010841 [Flemingia macrophylla]|uniref:K+ potassium transporter integral membrane domain-containing protein n=1 Tax=Flemingia macrophylla TaxID=520843 RepID=A0ABD1MMU3_9FABA
MVNINEQMGWKTTIALAFQSIGIVYDYIDTSPLYVFSGIFTEKIRYNDDILRVLSLIIYTIIIIPFHKYVLVVLHANNHGNGGAFALYSLICRHVKVNLIPNDQPEDKELSNCILEISSNKLSRAQKLKQKLENSYFARIMLILVTMMGTSMVIGDGIFTPAVSVLSAVSGTTTSLGQEAVMGIYIAILVVLFFVQRFGTDRVGSLFAPILLVWFSLIAGIGSEAMFADLGHFSVRAILISFTSVVFPAILIAYFGQAAYLIKFPEKVSNTFYACIPDHIYWLTFVVAVVAAIIASQAMISGAFSGAGVHSGGQQHVHDCMYCGYRGLQDL